MNRLKELRQSAGLTQSELAKIVETTQRNISYWESGNVELNLIYAIKLAQFFQVEVEYLAGYSDDLGIKPQLNKAVNHSYSDEEKQLIEDFRKLSPYMKGIALTTIHGMTGAKPDDLHKKA